MAVTILTLVGCQAQKARTQTLNRAIPVYEEPRHHLVFENDIARVLEVRVPAGDTTFYHIHANRITGVAVQDAQTWEQILGAPRGKLEAASPVPYLFDNWERPLPYTHRVANVDARAFHFVANEWRRSSGIDCATLPETSTRHLVKEGKVAKVYEIRLAPGESTEAHVHACPGLTVVGTHGSLNDEGTARPIHT